MQVHGQPSHTDRPFERPSAPAPSSVFMEGFDSVAVQGVNVSVLSQRAQPRRSENVTQGAISLIVTAKSVNAIF
jgi:hypothetical protein